MMNKEERFEADLRAALAPEPASADLRRRVLEQAVPRNQRPARPGNSRPGSARSGNGWLAIIDPRNWHLPRLVELSAAAAVASLAVGIFAGASGLVPTTTTATASTDSNTVDLVALAYDTSGIAGDLQ